MEYGRSTHFRSGSKSAKALKRFSEKTSNGFLPPLAGFRPFGTATTLAAVPADEYNQSEKYRDQIFTFIICKSFKNGPDSILQNLDEFGQQHGFSALPNIVVSLEDGFVQHVSLAAMALQHSPLTANGLAFVPEKPRAFSYLVHELRRHAREGRSVPLFALDRYMNSMNDPLPESRFRPYGSQA